MKNKLLSLLTLVFLLTACAPATPAPPTVTPLPPTPIPAETGPWWNGQVFYEIFVRSFNDSNGDGIGDFNGITAKLDYLNDGDPNTTTDLGVTGIWLMPIFPSPSYHGYDVTDYYSVNPQYGTMDDFKNLLQEAHKRGIHVIIDMVLNHTSDKHPWFKSAKSDANSPYRDWYIWSDADPKYSGPWGERVWHPSTTGYYYGIFESFMPDLNYENPAVTQEMEKVSAFWLKDVGVDGFRLDAAKHLIEDGTQQQNTQATHEWFKGYRMAYKADNPNALTVGEISGDNDKTLASYTSGDQLDLVFDFNLATAFIGSANSGKATPAVTALKISSTLMPEGQYAPFLSNHDQDRVMFTLGNNTGKAKVAASLLLTSPGTPFLYYGEEIGMIGFKPDENIRRPMQWSAEKNAGFTTGKPWRSVASDYDTVNVEAQMVDPDSLWSHYQALISLRNAHPALRSNETAFAKSGSSAVFASIRSRDGENILVLINLGADPVKGYTISLDKSALPAGQYSLISLMGGDAANPLNVSSQGGFKNFAPTLELPPFSTYIFQLKGE